MTKYDKNNPVHVNAMKAVAVQLFTEGVNSGEHDAIWDGIGVAFEIDEGFKTTESEAPKLYKKAMQMFNYQLNGDNDAN